MGGVGSGRRRRPPPLASAGEPTVVVRAKRGPVDVDASIAPIVAALNKAGVETVASCSGHGRRPGNIALRDGREIIIARNFEEARAIDRLFPTGANGESMQFSTPSYEVHMLAPEGGRTLCGIALLDAGPFVGVTWNPLRVTCERRKCAEAVASRDRDAALRRREAAEAEGQQPGPERSEGIAQLPDGDSNAR